MKEIFFSEQEFDLLHGMRWDAQLMYLRGIRPCMDQSNGISGLGGRLSRERFREILWVHAAPARSDYAPASITDSRIKSALASLARVGLVEPIDDPKKRMVFFCPHAPKPGDLMETFSDLDEYELEALH